MLDLAGYRGRVLSLGLCIGVLQPQVAASMDAEKRVDIQALIRDVGALATMDRAVDLVMPKVIRNFKRVNPNIPEATWVELSRVGVEELKKSLPELEEPLIAVYDANFRAEEIKQLIAFYTSPLGRKVVTQMPSVLQQGLALGQAWGERVGPRIAERIRAAAKQKGYNL